MNLGEVYMYLNLHFGEVFIVKPRRSIHPSEIRAVLGPKYQMTKPDINRLLKRMSKEGIIKIRSGRVTL